MVDVLGILRRRGGVARAGELAVDGVGRGALEAAVQRGEVWRPRKGWYVDPRLGGEVARAVRIGGSVTCVSSLAARGVWTPEGQRLHVRVAPESGRLRTPESRRRRLAEEPRDDVRIHWNDRPGRGSDDPLTALAIAARCSTRAEFFAILESALRLGVVGRADIRSLRRLVPTRRWSILDRATGTSESGSESLLRIALLDAGIPFRQQVLIPSVGRVDFVIGDWLIVEADSRAHHSDPAEDRRRDAAASILGYRTLRFMFEQIRWNLPLVMAAIRAARFRGDHRRSVVQEIR